MESKVMTRANLMGRRDWIASAIGLGAIGAGAIARAATGLFEAIEVNHVALRVADLATSEEFYRRVFGAPGIIFERPGQRYLRMGRNFVALFERKPPAMDHFAISIRDYDADAVQHRTETLGLNPRRSSSFAYVLDPDGIEVQIAHAEHEVHSAVVRERPETSVFRGDGVDHVAFRVSDLERSRDYYQRLFGLPVRRQSSSSCFLGIGESNFLALFQGSPAGMAHFCISVEGYLPDQAVERATRGGLDPRRSGNRVYFDDPDGLEVQIASSSLEP
jgi:catechol 2,3-dioxygenase-like lactoylglutathione lyase family enzyme